MRMPRRTDCREAPQELHLLVYTQDDAVRSGRVVVSDVSPDAAQVCFGPARYKEFSHVDAWHL